MSLPTFQFINPSPLIYITNSNGFNDNGQIVMGADYSIGFSKEEAKQIAAWLREPYHGDGRSKKFGLTMIEQVSSNFIKWSGLSLPRWACTTLPEALDAFVSDQPFTGRYGMPIQVEHISRGAIMQGVALFAVYQKDPLEAYEQRKAEFEKGVSNRVFDNSSFRLELGVHLFVLHHIRTAGVDILRALIETIQNALTSETAVVNRYSDHITLMASCRVGQPYRDEGSYRVVQRTPIELEKTVILMHDQGRFPGRIVLKEKEIPGVIEAIERAIVFFED